MNAWWPYLEEQTRREVDANVLCDRHIAAIRAVWEVLRPLGLGLHDAEKVVLARYAALADRVRAPRPIRWTSPHSRPALPPARAGWPRSGASRDGGDPAAPSGRVSFGAEVQNTRSEKSVGAFR